MFFIITKYISKTYTLALIEKKKCLNLFSISIFRFFMLFKNIPRPHTKTVGERVSEIFHHRVAFQKTSNATARVHIILSPRNCLLLILLHWYIDNATIYNDAQCALRVHNKRIVLKKTACCTKRIQTVVIVAHSARQRNVWSPRLQCITRTTIFLFTIIIIVNNYHRM